MPIGDKTNYNPDPLKKAKGLVSLLKQASGSKETLFQYRRLLRDKLTAPNVTFCYIALA